MLRIWTTLKVHPFRKPENRSHLIAICREESYIFWGPLYKILFLYLKLSNVTTHDSVGWIVEIGPWRLSRRTSQVWTPAFTRHFLSYRLFCNVPCTSSLVGLLTLHTSRWLLEKDKIKTGTFLKKKKNTGVEAKWNTL